MSANTQYVTDPNYRNRILFMELLNDININVLLIDNTYYATSSVDFPDYETLNELVFQGANITDLVETRQSTVGGSVQQQTELFQNINSRKLRTRVFHRDTKFIYYQI